MNPHILEAEVHSPLRARIVAGGLCLAFGAVGVQGGKVAILGATMDDTSQQAATNAVQSVRADILDRNGERLATSIPSYSLYADPSAIWDASEVAVQLSEVFPDLNAASLTERLSDPSRQFTWIKRELTPLQRQSVYELGLEGIGFREESRRFYPQKTVGAHLIGYTDVDGKGLSGVELSQNDRLATSLEPIHLTIDLGVQYSLEAELSSIAAKTNAKGGAGIVIEANTGDVLAMASWPSFDPNRRHAFTDHELKDRASGGVYELGSIFKPLTIAAALDHGKLNLRETFNVTKPITIQGETIEDDHPVPGGRSASVTKIIAESSNIGTVQIGMRMSLDEQRRYLQTLGLMERSPVELASSAAPILPTEWDDITRATVSFGHGISVSPIAFSGALSALANDGNYIAPTLLLDRDPLAPIREPRRILSTPTTDVVVEMMRQTVQHGTGRYSDIPGYRVAGKTGTAEKVIDGQYDDDRNVTSFAAVFPADDPNYAVLIVLDEPTGSNGRTESAAFNAAPTVGRVIERIAPILDVSPRFEDLLTEGPPVRSVNDRRSL